MNIKLTVLSAAILAVFSAAALAQPPAAPTMYAPGPASLQFQNLSLSTPERAAYALAEGVMQMAEATILANNSCSASVGTFPITGFFTDGFGVASNVVTVQSNGGAFTLQAAIDPLDPFRGQTMTITQVGTGSLNGTSLRRYTNAVSFNAAGTMMTGAGSVQASSVNTNGVATNQSWDTLQLSVIKDFYRDNVTIANPIAGQTAFDQVPVIYDWGLQSVSKLGYPLNKYWQRSKSLRNDGFQGYTHFVKDRLVGSSACHIELLTQGSNNLDFFSQNGTLTITTNLPYTGTGTDPLITP